MSSAAGNTGIVGAMRDWASGQVGSCVTAGGSWLSCAAKLPIQTKTHSFILENAGWALKEASVRDPRSMIGQVSTGTAQVIGFSGGAFLLGRRSIQNLREAFDFRKDVPVSWKGEVTYPTYRQVMGGGGGIRFVPDGDKTEPGRYLVNPVNVSKKASHLGWGLAQGFASLGVGSMAIASIAPEQAKTALPAVSFFRELALDGTHYLGSAIESHPERTAYVAYGFGIAYGGHKMWNAETWGQTFVGAAIATTSVALAALNLTKVV